MPDERVFICMLSAQPPKGVVALRRANCRIIVDECTNFKVFHFIKSWKDRRIFTKKNMLLGQRF